MDETKNTDKPLPIHNSKEFEIKDKKKGIYKISILTQILIILIYAFFIFTKQSLTMFIIYSIFAIPLFIIGVILFWIRITLDRKKIGGWFKKKLTKNFLIAHFILENGREKKEVLNMDKTGIKYEYEGGIYIVDLNCIYLDENNHPNIDYVYGIPNPLKYNYRGLIEKHINRQDLLQTTKDINEVSKVIDFEGKEVDLSYSSVNLKKFQEDKFLLEMHRETDNGLDMKTILMIVMGMIIIIMLIFILNKKA